MPLSAQEVFDSAIQFPLDVRASIAEKLVNNIEKHIHPDMEKQHCAVAKRRRDEVGSGKVESLDGNFVLQRVWKVLER